MQTEKIEQVIGLLEFADSIKQGEDEFYGPRLNRAVKAAYAELTALEEEHKRLQSDRVFFFGVASKYESAAKLLEGAETALG